MFPLYGRYYHDTKRIEQNTIYNPQMLTTDYHLSASVMPQDYIT